MNWRPEDLETEWSDELLYRVVVDALLNHRRVEAGIPLGPKLTSVALKLGLPQADSHWLNRVRAPNPRLDDRILEFLWALVLRGIAVPKGEAFVVTRRGEAALNESSDDLRVALMAGALRDELLQRCPAMDDTALKYAELAQDCFMSSHHEGAVVLLGAATELLVADLIEELNARQFIPEISEDQFARFKLTNLRDRLQEHRANLKTSIEEAGGSASWLGDLPDLLDRANAIRLSRNDAGHPSRILPRRSQAQTALMVFPHLAEALVHTTEELKAIRV